MKTATILQHSMNSGALHQSALKLFAPEEGTGDRAHASKGEGMRGASPVLLVTLLLLCALSSAVLVTLGYSFIYYFDALSRDARILSPLVMAVCFAAFYLLQSVAAGCSAELFFTGHGKYNPFIACISALGVSFACGMLFCGTVVLFPALLSLSFCVMGMFIAYCYNKEDKKNTVLAAAIGAIVCLFLAFAAQGFLYEGGFGAYFTDFVQRTQERFALYSADSMDLMITTAGGEEELITLLARQGFRIDLEQLELTAAEFLALYEESFATALSSMLFLIPCVVFCVCAVSSYVGYGVFRLFCIKRGDRARRELNVSLVAAAVFFACVMIHSFWAVFLGSGGVITVLIVNLIVMLAPVLFVPGVKSVKSLLKGMFSQNKLLGVLCVAIIVMSPIMVVALSGCYDIFSRAIKEYLQKKGMIP
ncbi:MAG: hypothetical protein IJX08_06850 [Clostridia bacterium]|nr:hypothetical protein [Clostridia bacterium]